MLTARSPNMLPYFWVVAGLVALTSGVSAAWQLRVLYLVRKRRDGGASGTAEH